MKNIYLFLMIIFCIFSTIYCFEAYKVSVCVYEDDSKILWRSSPPGSFIPWPRPSGILLVLSEMNEIDIFIYEKFIKSRIIILFVTSLWILVSLYTLKIYMRKY